MIRRILVFPVVVLVFLVFVPLLLAEWVGECMSESVGRLAKFLDGVAIDLIDWSDD